MNKYFVFCSIAPLFSSVIPQPQNNLTDEGESKKPVSSSKYAHG